jgi:hypothetical protein
MSFDLSWASRQAETRVGTTKRYHSPLALLAGQLGGRMLASFTLRIVNKRTVMFACFILFSSISATHQGCKPPTPADVF